MELSENNNEHIGQVLVHVHDRNASIKINGMPWEVRAVSNELTDGYGE